MRRPLVILALGLALMAEAPVGVAQPVPSDRRAEAQQLFRAGEQMFLKGSYEDAAGLFEQAHALVPLPAIAFSAAQAYRLQYFSDDDARKLKRAIELYEQYLIDVKQGGRRADAAQSLAELKPRLDRLEGDKRGPIGEMPMPTAASKLIVTTQVKGAKVAVDGGAPVSAPFSREVEPGKHRIVVTASGYVTFDEERDVFEDQSRIVEVPLVAKPALIRVEAERGAQVTVDGRAAGTAPLGRPLELAAGSHVIAVTMRGHRPWSRELKVERGESIALSPGLRTTTQRKLAYGVFAASAVGLIAAGVVEVAALRAGSRASDLDDKRGASGLSSAELGDYALHVARYDSRTAASLTLLGIGGGLAVTGALLYFLDQPRVDESEGMSASRRAGFDLHPVVGGEMAGLAVAGAF